MQAERAVQILQSPDNIGVQLEGQSVWIDSVDLETGEATVHRTDSPEHSQVVPASQLKEVH
ncbi:H-type small acid-soluble spore protein [Marinicrinis lubricantis]|uniref:H-type small acid-soluble spore protein n=1 Tax=Marinicrinis lubricantis TaxID=2086470 RepID=A0ABW1IR98_9BACL